jgi:K+:H+ antiporter
MKSGGSTSAISSADSYLWLPDRERDPMKVVSNSVLSLHFFIQLAVILLTCRMVGQLVKKIGQPQVVGEMIAGVLLGPSLLGLAWPGLEHRLFPAGPSMSILYAASQVGLVLYMFLVGVQFDAGLIRHRIHNAASVSLAGVATPLALGAVIAWQLDRHGSLFFNPKAHAWQAMIFLGACIAITAFPMLARIIVERGLAGTTLGTISLACGATDDAISWCLFAIVVASFDHKPMLAFSAIIGGVLYCAFTLTGGKALLARLGGRTRQRDAVSPATITSVLAMLMLAAWFTDWIGVYSIFGAFILGLAIPRGTLDGHLTRLLEPVTVNFLLPLFFVYSGLNTQIGTVDTPALWGVMLLLLLAASVLGKGGAVFAAARLNRIPRQESLAMASLMNARGLMELILLNLGRQEGLISPTLFSMLVFMAIITTLMASPLFEFAKRRMGGTDRLLRPRDLEPVLVGAGVSEVES